MNDGLAALQRRYTRRDFVARPAGVSCFRAKCQRNGSAALASERLRAPRARLDGGAKVVGMVSFVVAAIGA